MKASSKRAAIEGIERWLGAALPQDYARFLLDHQEGIIGEQVCLYGAESVGERNETYETKSYCPGYITIGDDSGGRAVVIPVDRPLGPVYLVGHGSMSPNHFHLLPQGFTEWIREGCVVDDD